MKTYGDEPVDFVHSWIGPYGPWINGFESEWVRLLAQGVGNEIVAFNLERTAWRIFLPQVAGVLCSFFNTQNLWRFVPAGLRQDVTYYFGGYTQIGPDGQGIYDGTVAAKVNILSTVHVVFPPGQRPRSDRP